MKKIISHFKPIFTNMLLIILSCLVFTNCAQILIGGASTGGLIMVQERTAIEAAKDIIIKTKIEESLFSSNYDDLFSKVKVIVLEGRVLLVGTLNNNRNRDKAAKIAWNTKNVREVANYTTIGKNQFIDYIKDSRISLEYRGRILTDSDISEVNFTSTTENRIIYIMGISQNKLEKDRIENIAKKIPGVKKVISLIITKDNPKRNLIKRK